MQFQSSKVQKFKATNMKRIYFDIETGPRTEEELQVLMPEFAAPANYKDPAKIAECITEKKTEWLKKAALDATSGKVLAIGLRRDGENTIFGTGDEALDIRAFWSALVGGAREGAIFIGFCISNFDLPFLVRRSWVLGVDVPSGVFSGRYLNHNVFLDLYEHWQCGDRGESISLKRLAEFLGVGTKDKDGATAFAEKWVTDRKAAIAYLENDLLLTEAVAGKLLGPWPPVAVLPSFVAAGPAKAPRAKKQEPATAGAAAAAATDGGAPQGAAATSNPTPAASGDY
jgi:hypothetical protein